MTELERMFYEHKDRWMHRYPFHLGIYNNFFAKFRGTDVHVLEIGSGRGGGLQLWKKYFGDKAQIFGIDSCAAYKKTEEDRIKMFIGKQEDIPFLNRVEKDMGRIDIVVDDASHQPKETVISFEELFPKMSDEAIYVIEDTHTSYRPTHGGGLKKEGTAIEYFKHLVDFMHVSGMPLGMLEQNDFTRITWAVHFYLNMILVEKSNKSRSGPIMSGESGV